MFIKKRFLPIYIKLKAGLYRLQYKKQQNRLKHKNNFKVAFLIVNEAIWKYEYLYALMEKNPKFQPVVFVCPFITYGPEIMRKEMDVIYQNFSRRGYKVVKTLLENGEYYDIENEFKPDLVFFSTPWNHTLNKYSIGAFHKSLTCYVPYAYVTTKTKNFHYNLPQHNLLWRFFMESKIHQKMAREISYIHARNTVVTGYPGLDRLLDKDYIPKEVWKPQRTKKKRVIWAPHHTIPQAPSGEYLSTFTKYCDFMLELAETYSDKIQFAFKPHPNLKGKLKNSWGTERTESYYQKWATLSYTQLEEGAYINLFNKSDAMIHDSGSFLMEYLYVDKPVCYLLKDKNFMRAYNQVGQDALKVLYQAWEKEDIIRFIEEVVLNGKDKLQVKREEFFNDYIRLPQGKLASENIMDYLIKQLSE